MAADGDRCTGVMIIARTQKSKVAILYLEGIDAFFIGPNDLAASMGLPTGLDNRHTEFPKAIKHLLALRKRYGVPGGIHASSHGEVDPK